MKLQEFKGGLSTRLNPHLLKLDEAVIYTNIDNSTGSLSPVKDKTSTGELCSRYNFYSNSLERWFSSDLYTYWADFGNAVVSSNGVDTPQVTYDTYSAPLGITAPPTPSATKNVLSTEITSATVASTRLPLGTGLFARDIEYLLVNDTGGEYSNPFSIVSQISDAQRAKPVDWKASKSLTGSALSLATGKGRTSIFQHVLLTGSNLFYGQEVTIGSVVAQYGSGGVHVYRKFADVWRRVGILYSSADSIVDSAPDISANAALDLSRFAPLIGTYQYVVTYYDAVKGRESGPCLPTPEIDATTSGVISLTGLTASSDSSVTHKRLYRVGGDVDTFTLVAEIPNATTSFVDTISDVDLQAVTLTTDIDLPAPVGLKFITSANTMLFGAVGTRLVFTPISKPESWPALYFIEFDAEVTGVAAVYSGLIVCTVDRTYAITGSGPTSLSKSVISLDQGCVSQKSMQTLKGTAFWLSQEGVCASSGDSVIVISRPQLGALSLTPTDSALVQEVYYLLTDTTCLAFDTAYGNIFKSFEFGVDSLARKGGALYGHSSGYRHKLFSSSSNLPMHYKSPKFIEGRYTDNKLYKKLYFYCKGDIIIKIYINDALVTTKSLNTEDNHVVLVPQELQRGNAIQIEVEGTGEVLEVEYEVGRNSPDGR